MELEGIGLSELRPSEADECRRSSRLQAHAGFKKQQARERERGRDRPGKRLVTMENKLMVIRGEVGNGTGETGWGLGAHPPR